MSEISSPGVGRRWLVPMVARRTDEEHRAATPLELLFDLCFVVAVAQAASTLHHDLAEDHLSQGLVGYPLVFFAIWWAWMNFTWFASAYDTDDVVYRLVTLVQIGGVLVLAAGVPRAMDDREFGIVVLGYVIMRLAMVAQWLRAAGSDTERRGVCLRYAIGITVCQVGWVLLVVLPETAGLAVFIVMAAIELAVPVWAERATQTTWHPIHIAERYGLFTIIVLGESITAVTIAVQVALDSDATADDLMLIAAGSLLMVFSMWWLYFSQPSEAAMSRARLAFGEVSRLSFLWGYSHVFVFAAIAAVGAGISVVVDDAAGLSALSSRGALLTVAVPLAVYIVSVWLIHRHATGLTAMDIASPAAAAIVLIVAAIGLPLWVMGLVPAVLVAVRVFLPSEERVEDPHLGSAADFDDSDDRSS